VWYRFRGDHIRDDEHFNKALNYIHQNPTKHRYVRKAIDWPCTSLHTWLKDLGRDAMRELWWRYPIDDDFGRGWDE
jgi:hypothetical protein